MDKRDPFQNPNRARELLAAAGEILGEEATRRRVQSYVTYVGSDEEVAVPHYVAADFVAAEEHLGYREGGETIPFMRLQFHAKTQSWMSYRALFRHPDERHRPKGSYEEWLQTVDEAWDEGAELVPLAVATRAIENALAENPSPPSTDG